MGKRRRQILTVLLSFLLIAVSIPKIGTQSELASTSFVEAELLGLEHDEGLDTDEDGTFDYLVLGVEVNVVDVGFYEVHVSGLLDSNSNGINVYGSEYSFLEVGLHILNVSLDGRDIFVSGLNPSNVSLIELYGGEYEWETYYIANLWNVPLSKEYSYTDFDTPAAFLTGNISDHSEDTDGDGTANYLEIGVQINFTESVFCSVEVYGLRDIYGSWIDIQGYESGNFDVGLDWLNVSLSGYRIRGSGVNASFVDYISLYADYYSHLNDVPLSRQYNYTEFDAPAFLTGVISDEGLDTDDDGAFNFLEIGVEVNVSDPGNYRVEASGLLDESFNHIDVYASTSEYLENGSQFVNFTLDSWRIFLSGRDPMYIDAVSLVFWEDEEWREDYRIELSQVPLSIEYLHTDFDPPGAMLTGEISDQGVDTDSDLKFDYLEVGVEVDVTDAGTYVLHVSGLYAAGFDGWDNYISVWDSKIIDLSVGVQTVNLYLYGPQIYVQRHNPVNVSHMSIYDEQYTFYESIHDVPLSREYSYTDFDAPSTNVETKFVVYPDGRVAVEGALEYSNMYPKYTGPVTQGSFNLTSTQASAGLTINLPDEFPYNSTTAHAELLGEYSEGLLDLGINSTMILPSAAESLYPYGFWNTTDGTITATYSEGILNIGVEGNTTLPSIATSQFPFNATDLAVVGTYSPHTLDGRITFSMLPDFTFDDVNVDFTGNQTDLSLNGTVHLVYNVPFNGFVIHNETELIQMIDLLKSDFVGENGIVWNMTNGLLNVTNLDIDHIPNGIGASVTFTMEVHGDFVRALGYLMSGGRNEMLLYPALTEAYESVQNGSFDVQYDHDILEASVKLTFSYDLKRLIDYVLAPPTGTTPYIMTCYHMSPSIYSGDVVFVEPVTDAGNIKADPVTGDIIAFYSPSNNYPHRAGSIVAHRAINKTFSDDTWYFQTKGEGYYSPDYWTGNNTLDGMVSEDLLIGNASSRIPFLGYLLSYPYSPYYIDYYPYLQSTVATRMELMKSMFLSVENISVQLSYSNVDRRFDFQYTQVSKLEALRDELARILPELVPPETPPEFKSIVESLLNTTYASISTAHAALSYENGQADFKATATIEGDLNGELNYVKDLYLQLASAMNSYSNVTIPWQWAFMNQTEIDVDNLRVSAKLDETSFEGRVEGLTLLPPMDSLNATHFRLERFFNLTAPQYSWQGEFPEQNQKLKVTIEGVSNATHKVTLWRPLTVPEPDVTAPDGESMVWFNQTLSSLKDLIFTIERRITGTLVVTTTPVMGEVFVNGELWGLAPQSRVVDVGTYNVSFSSLAGYYTPTWQLATVQEDTETVVTGVYELITGTLTVTTTPVAGEILVDGISWGIAPQSRVVEIGIYNVSFGAVIGYYTPAWQLVEVSESVESSVSGAYTLITGTLTITTTPIAAEVFVNDTSWGVSPQSRAVQTGTYNVSFGDVTDYHTPAWQLVTVSEKVETSVEGVYEAIPTQIWTQPEFLAIIGTVVAAIAIIAVILMLRRRKPKSPTTSTLG